MKDKDQYPLFVDLDGTLVKTDLLLESIMQLIKSNILYLFMLPFWLLRGRARLKSEIAKRTRIRYDLLPFNTEFKEFLLTAAATGRRLVLISASIDEQVKQVANHVGIFDLAIGSSATNNLKGSRKLECIRKICSDGPFVYAGNEKADLPVWGAAEAAIVVNASPSILRSAEKLTRIEAVFKTDSKILPQLTRSLRLHQWLKNALIFLPLILSHQILDSGLLMIAFAAFLAFGLCASSVYLLNDLLDLDADRLHATKRFRPFAAGDLSIKYGLVASPILLVVAFAIASQVSLGFMLVLGIYYFLTLLYSLLLKAVIIVDVLVLAGLYTIRIIAGAAAISVMPTFWLLVFSMFLFLSLAIIKRVAELDKLANANQQRAAGRGYETSDLQILSMLGSASGLMSVLVFALYLNDEKTRALYETPEVLWLICPLLLYLIGRIWIIAHRGKLHHDPVVFVARDTRSQVVVLFCGLLVWLASNLELLV